MVQKTNGHSGNGHSGLLGIMRNFGAAILQESRRQHNQPVSSLSAQRLHAMLKQTTGYQAPAWVGKEARQRHTVLATRGGKSHLFHRKMM